MKPPRCTPAEYAIAVKTEVGRMAAAVRASGTDARVPTCPEWNVAELVEHTGRIHRWAAAMVRDCAAERLDARSLDLGLPPDPSGYADWLAAGADVLGAAFAATDPDCEMWVWGADQHARFWSRRMLHETTIHRVDAQLAGGVDPSVDAATAADGLDELLDNLPSARYFRPRVAELLGSGETIALHSTDTDDSWRIRLEPDGFAWERARGAATTTVRAATDSLLLLLYTRRPLTDARLAIAGDDGLLARWLECSAL